MNSLAITQSLIPDLTNFSTLIPDVDTYQNKQIPLLGLSPANLAVLLDQLEAAKNNINEGFIDQLIAHLKERAAEEEKSQDARQTSPFSSSASSGYLSGHSSIVSLSPVVTWSYAGSKHEMKLTAIEKDVIQSIFLQNFCVCGDNPDDLKVGRVTDAAQRAVSSLYLDFIECQKSQKVQFCITPPRPPIFSWRNDPATWTAEAAIMGRSNLARTNDHKSQNLSSFGRKVKNNF